MSAGVLGTASSRVPIWPSVTFGTPPNDCQAEKVYVFQIDSDCNGNGIADSTDLDPPDGSDPQFIDVNNNGILDVCEYTSTTCGCDWNGNQIVSVQDLFDFLADYFAGNGDFNNSGATTVQDIFDFLACFFAPPPACFP